MNILVLNCGSSSLKFQVIETDLDIIKEEKDKQLAKGIIGRIGGQALITLQANGRAQAKQAAPLRDHRAALDYLLRWIVSAEANIASVRSLGDIHAVGHRVVHGGEKFTRSVVIEDDIIKGIEDCIDLAPLHNPANLKGIQAAQSDPSVQQVKSNDGDPERVVFLSREPLRRAQ